MGVGRFVYTPILPEMVAALGLSKAEAGLLASANFIGYLLGALLAASPAIRGSKRGWLVGGLAASALTTGAMGYVGDLPAFLALRFAGGVASAFVLVFASTLVLDRLAAAGRSSLSAVHFAGVGIGIAVSAVIVSASIAAGTDWRGLWIDSAVAALAALFIAAILIPGGAEPPARAEQAHAGGRGLGALILAYGLFGFGYIITATFLPVIARGALPPSPWLDGFWPIFGLGVVMGALGATRLRIHGDLRRLLAGAYLVQAAGIGVGLVSPTLAGFALGSWLLGLPFTAITFFAMQELRRLRPANAAPMMGLATALFGIGQAAGPPLAAWILRRASSQQAGFTLALGVAAGSLLFGAAVYLAMTRWFAFAAAGPRQPLR